MVFSTFVPVAAAVILSGAVTWFAARRVYGGSVGKHVFRGYKAEAERILYRNLFDHASDGIVLMDENYQVCEVNQSFLKMFDFAEEELLGNPLYQYILTSEYANKELPDALIRVDQDQYETVRTRKNGMPVVVRISTFTLELPTEGGYKTYICSQYTDITEKQESERRIRELAYYDSLTSLPNRYLLESRVSEMLMVPGMRQFSFVYMDLNGFKHINDTLGHEFGDELLIAFSKRVRGNIKEDDFFARMGGDEFVLLLPKTPREHASKVIERINELLNNPFHIKGQRVFVGLAAGIAAFPDDAASPDELYRFSDIAMYTAKQKKLPYLYYDQEMQKQYKERMELEQQLVEALKQDEQFVLHYLPVYDLKEERFVSFEALCRWDHPQEGVIPSARFIPIAEDSQLIYRLGRLVLDKVFKQSHLWVSEGYDFLTSVNLSAKELLLAETIDYIEELVGKYPGIQKRLEIEITEAASLIDAQQGRDAVGRLKAMGFKIILDDFGIGYSSLNFLRDLRADSIKVDKHLIDDVKHANSTGLILKGLLHLAHTLGVEVIAEGISTQEQRDTLAGLGFRYMQGFLFSKPLVADQVPALVKNKQLSAIVS
ncbi:MAG: sensor domain-containing protein [Spirochaetota bacterium]